MAAKADRMNGIYIIEDAKMKYVYVGKSTGVGVALRSAKSKLKRGVHHNVGLQQAYFKRGEYFVFKKDVLVNLSVNQLRDKAENIMDDYLADDWLLYNDVITFDVDGDTKDIIEDLSPADRFIVDNIVRGLSDGIISETIKSQLNELAKSI